jgi:hypothetical protein
MTAVDPGLDVKNLGKARSTGPSVQDLLEADTRDVPVSLKDHSYELQGIADVPKSRYT